MKHIIKQINDEIKVIEKNLKLSEKSFDLIDFNLSCIKIIAEDPDDIEIENVMADISEQNEEKVKYIEKFIGFFKSNPDEPQIKLARIYLKDVIKDLESTNLSVMAFIVKVINVAKRNLELLNNLLIKMQEYDSSVYITEEEFNVLNALFSNQDIEEPVLDEFVEIAKNNALLKAREISAKRLMLVTDLDEDSILEQMDKDRTAKNIKDKMFEDIAIICADKNILKMFFNNLNLYELAINFFKSVNSMKKLIEVGAVETADLFKSEYENIEEKDVYMCALALNLIDAINSNNLTDAKSILEEYKQRTSLEKKQDEENVSIEQLVTEFNKVIDSIYDEPKYLNFEESYSGMSKEEIINVVGVKKYALMYIMSLIHEYKINEQEYSLEQVKTAIKSINEEIDRYKEIIKEEVLESTIDIDVKDGLDVEDVLNYIVILSPERLRNNIQEIIDEYPSVNISTFHKALSKLLLVPHEEFYKRDTCKPIKISKNTNNQYEIREDRSGMIRITFKAINTADGKVVYEILSYAFGSCDGKAKTDNLFTSIREYETHIDEYRSLEKNIRENNLASLSTLISNGLSFYNGLVEEDKKEFGENI